MSLILQVLTGTFPPFLARRKTPRKRSPEYLEAARSYWRQRRAAQTKEDRDAEYLRKKEILASLSDQEYARRRALATANMQRWRAKKKLNQQGAKHEQRTEGDGRGVVHS